MLGKVWPSGVNVMTVCRTDVRPPHWHCQAEDESEPRTEHRSMTVWLDRAACRDVDPEIFFPIGTGVLAERQVIRAKAVCHRCPVRAECLRWAQVHGQGDGVWGGLDADERRELRRSTAQRAGRNAA